MKSSFVNRTYNCLSRNKYKVLTLLGTYFQYLTFKFQDIEIGYNCKFYGLTSCQVGNGGFIKIGKNCKFISNEKLNRIGLSHRCMLTATPVDESLTCTLTIGDNCGFSGTSIWCFKNIVIGNNVRCGANTLIMDGDAHFDDPRTSLPRSIIIKDNVFLGANVIVKKGVVIGENSVIGMNSVVTKDIPANCIAVGNPCKVIKQL